MICPEIRLGLMGDDTIRAEVHGDQWGYGKTVEEAVAQMIQAGKDATRRANSPAPFHKDTDDKLDRFSRAFPAAYVCEVEDCWAPARYKAPAGEYYCAAHGDDGWEQAPRRGFPGHATRVDIVTVRDPDYSNVYNVFVNGEDVSEGSGGYVMGLPLVNELRVEVWDIDLGSGDLSDPAEWSEWTYARADHDSDVTIPKAVRECIANVAMQVAEKHGHEYPVK